MEAGARHEAGGVSTSAQPSTTGARYGYEMMLPPEMWRDICDMLYEDCDLRTLSALSRTCRSLNEMTIPIIYSKLGVQFACWSESEVAKERIPSAASEEPDEHEPPLEKIKKAITLFPVFDPPLCHYSLLCVKRRPDTVTLERLFGNSDDRYAHLVRSLTVNLWCIKKCSEAGAPGGQKCFDDLVDNTYDWIKKMTRLHMFRWGLSRAEPPQVKGAHNIPLKLLLELNDPSRMDSPITQLCLEGTATKDIASLLPPPVFNEHGEDVTQLGPLFKNLKYVSMSMDAYYEGMDKVLQACQRSMRQMIVTPDARYAWYDNSGQLRMSSMSPAELYAGPKKLDMQYLDLTGFSDMRPDHLRIGLNLEALRTLIIIADNDRTPRDCLLELVGDPLRGRTELPNVVNLQYEGEPLEHGWERVAFLPKLKRLDAELYETDLEIFMNVWEHGICPADPPKPIRTHRTSDSSDDEFGDDDDELANMFADMDDDDDFEMEDRPADPDEQSAVLDPEPEPPTDTPTDSNEERVYCKPDIGRIILAFHEHMDDMAKPMNVVRERVETRRSYARQLASFGVRWIGIRERLVGVTLPSAAMDPDDSPDDLAVRLPRTQLLIARIDELNDDGTPKEGVNISMNVHVRKALDQYRNDLQVNQTVNVRVMYRTKFRLEYPPGGRVRMVDPKEEHCTCIL